MFIDDSKQSRVEYLNAHGWDVRGSTVKLMKPWGIWRAKKGRGHKPVKMDTAVAQQQEECGNYEICFICQNLQQQWGKR